ncbi:hypothetical protein MSG28_007196 [Choristoneura fumiferana]|uniref:Uncharacterized protein n=1 Tax=Choristoneura fumiferana TaxID=7141 RepID=A0ACC0JMS3_CHOFU|nr:hypothetical protein MSG28_007196 [Choristoneura fumiferana]
MCNAQTLGAWKDNLIVFYIAWREFKLLYSLWMVCLAAYRTGAICNRLQFHLTSAVALCPDFDKASKSRQTLCRWYTSVQYQQPRFTSGQGIAISLDVPLIVLDVSINYLLLVIQIMEWKKPWWPSGLTYRLSSRGSWVQTCGITFEIYHELCGEGQHREETCTNLRSNSMVRVKFPIRTGPAWELWPKPSCSALELPSVEYLHAQPSTSGAQCKTDNTTGSALELPSVEYLHAQPSTSAVQCKTDNTILQYNTCVT